MDFIRLSTNRQISNNSIDIVGDELTISITDSTLKDTSYGDLTFTGTFSLSSLINLYAQDHGCLAIYPEFMGTSGSPLQVIETTQLSYPERTATGDTYSSFQTTPNKQYSGSPFSVINTRFNSYGMLYILTPSANCSVDDLIIVFRDATSNSVKQDGSDVSFTTENSLKMFLDTWLPITVDGPSTITAGSTQAFTVTAPANTTVYLSADIGVINRSRIQNGQTVNLDTTGLTAGETITIKTGYKYWAGVSTKTITLT